MQKAIHERIEGFNKKNKVLYNSNGDIIIVTDNYYCIDFKDSDWWSHEEGFDPLIFLIISLQHSLTLKYIHMLAKITLTIDNNCQ